MSGLFVVLVIVLATSFFSVAAHAQADAARLIAECDRLAASIEDPDRPSSVAGVPFGDIDPKLAVPACDAAAVAAGDARMFYQLGRALSAGQQHEYARQAFAIADKSGYAMASVELGHMHEMGLGGTRDLIEAGRWYKRALDALEQRSNSSRAKTLVGRQLRDLGARYERGDAVPRDFAEAERWYAMAAQAGDKDSAAALQRLRVATGPPRAARPSAPGPTAPLERPKTPSQEIKNESPPAEPANSPEEFNKRGRTYAANGDYANADADFSEAIRGKSRYAEAFNNRCWTRAVMGRAEEAIADCNQAIRLRVDYADAFDSRGLAYLKLGEFDRALADFNTALRLSPKRASSLYGRGVAELRRGQASAGNADIADAKRIDPGIVQEYEQYGVE